MVHTDIDPAAIAGQVVDPERDGLLDVGAGEVEVVVLDVDGIAGGSPFATGHGEPPEMLALLGVYADHRLTSGLVVLDLFVDVSELGITIGMLGTFQGLGIGLQAEPGRFQQPSDRRR